MVLHGPVRCMITHVASSGKGWYISLVAMARKYSSTYQKICIHTPTHVCTHLHPCA